MFSIIIPVYNKESFIEKTIESVINQTYQEFEIIIVDDGSTDNSMEVIKSLENQSINVFRKENGGVSSARNLGIKKAKYQYIAFLDADDIWHPRYLETINSLIKKYPTAKAYHTNYKPIYDNSDINVDEYEDKGNDILINDYFDFVNKHKVMWTSSVVINKEVFEVISMFPLKYSRGEDLYVWIQIGLKFKIAYSSQIRAYYNKGVQNSLTKTRFDISQSFSNDAEKFYINYKELAPNAETFKKYMAKLIVSDAKNLLFLNKKKQARILAVKYWNIRSLRKRIIQIIILSCLPNFLLNLLLKYIN